MGDVETEERRVSGVRNVSEQDSYRPGDGGGQLRERGPVLSQQYIYADISASKVPDQCLHDNGGYHLRL